MKKRINIKEVFKYKLGILLAIILLIMAKKISSQSPNLTIINYYGGVFTDLFIMGFVIPVYMCIMLNGLENKNSFQILLRFQNKNAWWNSQRKLILINSITYSMILNVPLIIFIVIRSSNISIKYGMINGVLLISLFSLVFSSLGIISEVFFLYKGSKFIALFLPILLVYIPTLLKKLLKIEFLPSIGEFMNYFYNLSSADSNYLLKNFLILINTVAVFYIISCLGSWYIKRIDMKWR